MVDRFDKVTTAKAQQDVFFADLLDNFDMHPNTGQLTRVTNESSIKQALKNIVMTNMGERLYQPLVGGSVKASLFEPGDNFTANYLVDNIKQTIFNNETRVNNLDVQVTLSADGYTYSVTINFTTFNNPDVSSVDITLTRIR